MAARRCASRSRPRRRSHARSSRAPRRPSSRARTSQRTDWLIARKFVDRSIARTLATNRLSWSFPPTVRSHDRARRREPTWRPRPDADASRRRSGARPCRALRAAGAREARRLGAARAAPRARRQRPLGTRVRRARRGRFGDRLLDRCGSLAACASRACSRRSTPPAHRLSGRSSRARDDAASARRSWGCPGVGPGGARDPAQAGLRRPLRPRRRVLTPAESRRSSCRSRSPRWRRGEPAARDRGGLRARARPLPRPRAGRCPGPHAAGAAAGRDRLFPAAAVRCPRADRPLARRDLRHPPRLHDRGAALAAAVMAFPLMVRAIRLALDAVDPGSRPRRARSAPAVSTCSARSRCR